MRSRCSVFGRRTHHYRQGVRQPRVVGLSEKPEAARAPSAGARRKELDCGRLKHAIQPAIILNRRLFYV